MGVDGPLGDDEPLGDLPVGQAGGDQLRDLALAPGERQVIRRGRGFRRPQPESGGDPVTPARRPARPAHHDRGGPQRSHRLRRHRADLRFLDQPEAAIPVSLPDSALFLARAGQDLIAASELTVVARQMNPDAGHELTDSWASDVLIMQQKDRPPAEFAGKLTGCPVRGESLAGDLRTAAFAKLATKAAAVATAALSSAPEVPGAVRPVLASARTVTRTGYLAVPRAQPPRRPGAPGTDEPDTGAVQAEIKPVAGARA